MKVGIDAGERYPFYSLNFSYLGNTRGIEVSQKFINRYNKITKAFEAMQDELSELNGEQFELYYREER